MTAASVDERCPSCGGNAGDNWFDRSFCPEPCGSMHTRCAKCGTALDGCRLEDEPSDFGGRSDEERGPEGNDGRALGSASPAAKRQEPMQQMDADGNVVWEDYPPDELPTIAELVGCWCRAYDADSNESGWRPCPPSLCEMEDHDHA